MGVLANQLCVNSNEGHDSFARQYQRSKFWYQREAECKGSHPALSVYHTTVLLQCSYPAAVHMPSIGVCTYIYIYI